MEEKQNPELVSASLCSFSAYFVDDQKHMENMSHLPPLPQSVSLVPRAETPLISVCVP